METLDTTGLSERNKRILARGVSGGATMTREQSQAGGVATTSGQPGPPAPLQYVPFVRGAHEHTEPFDDFTSLALSANAQAHGPVDVPAYGYLRHIIMLVTIGTAGSGGSAVAAGDSPWIVFQNVQLTDVNGAFLVGPLNGYDLYILNKYGGYVYEADPNMSPVFSPVNATTGNFAFLLRVPVEICLRDGLGALPNQNAASTYKISYTINTAANVYTTSPVTTNPTVRVRLYVEAWSQPMATDVRGQPQATVPPAMGTTQFWSKFTKGVAAGAQTIQLPRVGNMLRNVIFMLYSTATPSIRTNADFPDPIQILWDARLLLNEARDIRRHYAFERWDYAGATGGISGAAAIQLDTGVFVYDFTHEFTGHGGFELRDLWLPTTQATRLELSGTFGAAASALVVLTNDVAPVGDVAVS